MLEAIQIDWMHTLQQIRTPWLDLFFKSLNFFDTQNFYALLIPAIWFGKDWKAGVRFFILCLLSFFCINELKEFFLEPRPFLIDPTVAIIRVSGHSFPSGGAVNAILLPSLLVYHIRKTFIWMIAIPYFLLISLSRIYLGVHYPIDIIGGWVLGLALFLFYIYCFPKTEKWICKQSTLRKFFLSQAFPCLLLFFSPKLYSAYIAMGMFAALFICHRFHFLPASPRKVSNHLLQGLIGVLISLSLHTALNKLFENPPSMFILGFFVVIIGSYLCHKTKKI